MNIEDLPTNKHLREQMKSFEVLLKANKALQLIGLGSEKIAELNEQYASIRSQLDEQLEYGRKYNAYFVEDGWMIHDSLDFGVLRKAVDTYETEGKDAAIELLLDYYGPDSIEERVFFFATAEELQVRRKFIDFALDDCKEGRYYSAIPLLLMTIDGAVNDAVGTGFHARGLDLDLWDSLTVADGAIHSIKGIFQKSRKKTRTDTIHLPYRHGILHGMDLGYDNQVVAAKCWCSLFIVRDWILARKSEQERREHFEEETRVPSLKEIGETLTRNENLKQALNEWEPRPLPPEYVSSLTDSSAVDCRQPECAALAFLELWATSNYGDMAKLFWSRLVENPKQYAGTVRENYGWIAVEGFSLLRIVDEAPAITEVHASITSPDQKQREVTLRLIYEAEGQEALPRNIPGGTWKIVTASIKNDPRTAG